MDDSQSSEVFSINSDAYGSSPSAINQGPCKQFLDATVTNLSKDIMLEAGKPTFCNFYCQIIDDCDKCICRRLQSISSSAECGHLNIIEICQYLEDIITLLQLLANTMKELMKTEAMTCRAIKAIPVSTGHILVTIFTHCKESESLYGSKLHNFEGPLKDLFKTCHSLQLVYLTILEKHFVFDLADDQEIEILVETFQVNLKIGVIVQSLDLKTMAEQWKAFTSLCERYSNYLFDRTTYQDSCDCLCQLIVNNFQVDDQEADEKTVLRAIKVTTFMLKILMKVSQIFKHAVDKKYHDVLEMLLKMQLQNGAYLKYTGKSPKYIQMVTSNIFHAVEGLVSELVTDQAFVEAVLHYNCRIENQDQVCFQYALLLVSIMRSLVHVNNTNAVKYWLKDDNVNLISKVFDVISLCHVYLNLDLQFTLQSTSTYLYEYILAHASAVVTMLDGTLYEVVVKHMIEALMGTNEYSAMFASDLWCVTTSATNSPTTIHELKSLCEIYKSLCENRMFRTSPQYVHITYTMRRLFDNLHKEGRLAVYEKFSLKEVNSKIWTVFGVKSLPNSIRKTIEDEAMDQCVAQLSCFVSGLLSVEDVDDLIENMRLASTCPLHFASSNLVTTIVNSWMKLCPQNDCMNLVISDLSQNNVWFVEFIKALKDLTMGTVRFLSENEENMEKILHVLSRLVGNSNLEIKLIILSLVLDLLDSNHFTKKLITNQDLKETLKLLLKENDIFKSKIFQRLKQNEKIEQALLKVTIEDHSINSDYTYFCYNGKLRNYCTQSFEQQMRSASQVKFDHKCLPNNTNVTSLNEVKDVQRSSNNNFEFADIDALLCTDSDTEPLSKKAKLEPDETEKLINEIESNIDKLCKLNISTHKHRIEAICDKLRRIID